MTTLRRCANADDFVHSARRRLPRPLFDYVEGGADDELTLRANTGAFASYHLLPRVMRDIRSIDMRRRVLGCDLEWPLILAPTGMTRLFHPDGECGVAKAAATAGVGYTLSTMASTSIEDVARSSAGPKIYQLYLLADDALNLENIDRAKAAGYNAVVLTVDTVVSGNRERDVRSGLTIPPKFTASSLAQFAARPGWVWRYLRSGKFTLPNVTAGDPGDGAADLSTLSAFFAAKMERHISWERLERLVRHWNGPFGIKGLQAVEDGQYACDAGATAVILSNHGGRQLDGGAATIDLLADMADALGDRLEIILDGGVRRGTHIAKALALGARACMIGRPYVYALAAYGEAGVARLLDLLRGELARTLGMLGCASVNDLERSHIRVAGSAPHLPHLRRRDGVASALDA